MRKERDGINGLYIEIVEEGLETEVPTILTDEKRSQEEAELGRNSDVEKTRRE